MSYNWMTHKQQHIDHLDKAGITDKKFRTLYLRFQRRVNTLWNNMGWSKQAWETLCSSIPYNQASELLEQFNGGGYLDPNDPPKYWEQWKRVCDVSGTTYKANLGDHLC